MKIWKWIITWWLKFNPPNLKRLARIGWYPLGTKYVAPDGRVHRYIRKIKNEKESEKEKTNS